MNNDLERARDHLANERTFLAWLRTAIGIIVFGFAVGRFALAVQQLAGVEGRRVATTGMSLWLGNAAILFGIGVIVAAFLRFRRVQQQLESGRFDATYGLLLLVAVVAALFAAALIVYLVLVQASVG